MQRVGQVSALTVHRVDNSNSGLGINTTGSNSNTGSASSDPTFQQRLERGMEEANQLTDRLRDSVARREDLVERYRATRERLNALKRQRRDIVQEERSLLLVSVRCERAQSCLLLMGEMVIS